MAKVKTKKKKHTAVQVVLTFFVTFFALCGLGTVGYIAMSEDLDFQIIVGDWFKGKSPAESSITVGNQFGLVSESPEVDDSYFDDAVFLGDSLTVGMTYLPYVNQDNVLGVTGIHLHQVLDNKAYPTRSGRMTTAVRAVEERKPAKIYLMLGTNGLAYTDMEDMIKDYTRLVTLLKEDNPDADIYIQSIPPATQSYVRNNSGFTVKKVVEYNTALLNMAKEQECYFLDTYSQFVTESGYLPRSLSSDNGVHLNDDAYDIMFRYLKTHTVQMAE